LKRKNKILLIGGSGTLGSSIIKSKSFKNLESPTKKKLNLLKRDSIKKFLNKEYSLIINCAAMARMKECEKKPKKAINLNILGTINLCREILEYKNKFNKEIKLIHISTDGVYASTKGNYSEKSRLKPYNVYGWTKMWSEEFVKVLKNYIIIRTRFFNKKKIRFNNAATDIFTSMIEVQELVKKIKFLSSKDFVGVINVGGKRESDFKKYIKYQKNIKPCKRTEIVKNLNFKIAKDASMNLKLFKSLKK